MSETIQTQIHELRQSLETIQGFRADELQAIRKRMEFAVMAIDEGYPDQARKALQDGIDQLRQTFVGGDVGGRA